MLDSFNIALSGLDANSEAINNVGDNLANLNTTGYKADSTDFQDMVTSTFMSSGETPNGTGVGQTLNLRQFTQGTIETTTNGMDAAIQGDGFFVVNDSGTTEYTRDGAFTTDANGNLTTADGAMVQGWMAGTDGTVSTSGAVGNITIPPDQTLPPVATTSLSADINLDASAVAGSSSGTFSVPIQVYDSLGVAHTLTITFTQPTGSGTGGTGGTGSSTPGTWDYSISMPSSDFTTAPTAPLATGTLTFNSSGVLTSPASGSPVNIAATGLADGAADMSINWNLYDSSGNPTITQVAEASSASTTTQNGSAAASVTGISISNGGQVVATYSNGAQQVEAQVALAGISNPDSLISAGNNSFVTSAQTATPVIGMPETGGRGQIEGSSLEESNVDIGTEFTNLMIYERAYQADSKVILTTDDMMDTLVNLIQQ